MFRKKYELWIRRWEGYWQNEHTVNKTAVLTSSFYGILSRRCFPYSGIITLVPDSGDGRVFHSNMVSRKSYCRLCETSAGCTRMGAVLVRVLRSTHSKCPYRFLVLSPLLAVCPCCGSETYDVFLIPPATLYWVVTRLLLLKSQLFPPLFLIKPLDFASYYRTVHLLWKPFVRLPI